MINTTYYVKECDYYCFCSNNCTSKYNAKDYSTKQFYAAIVNTVDCQPKEQKILSGFPDYPVFRYVAIGCWVLFGVFLVVMIVLVKKDWKIWQEITNKKWEIKSDGTGLFAAIERFVISCIEKMVDWCLSICRRRRQMKTVVLIGLWKCLISDLFDIAFDIEYLSEVVGEDYEELLVTPDYVIWLMFGFILTGIAKFYGLYYIVKVSENWVYRENWAPVNSLGHITAWNKIFDVCIAFVLEDFVEVGAQYFFFDKYQTSFSWTVVLNGAFMVLMSMSMYEIVVVIKKEECSCNHSPLESKPVCKWKCKMFRLCLYICPVWIIFLHVCRLGGAGYQMWSGEVRNGCLQYIDDRLVKTPLGEGCLISFFDWFILVSLCILFIPAFFMSFKLFLTIIINSAKLSIKIRQKKQQTDSPSVQSNKINPKKDLFEGGYKETVGWGGDRLLDPDAAVRALKRLNMR